ncbi:MAG: hypothetical protein ACI8X5_003675 [Planctomycetota bacterium]|jgi:hypothetical protein
MSEMDGVQDVFCGTETIVHMKSGSAELDIVAIEAAFEEFEIVCEGVERDDSAML